MTEAWFEARSVLAPHTHERPIFAVMLGGSFETAVSGRRLDCVAGTAWTEPAEERHTNLIGSLGARVLVTQPDPRRTDMFGPFQQLLGEVHAFRDPTIIMDARRIAAELGTDDALSPLMIDALVVGMLSSATRLAVREQHHARPPAWLLRVRDALHEGFANRPALDELATLGEVHPSHLAHAFRRHFGVTVGAYARTIRLAWALDRLAHGNEPISTIAIAAGFADQSHLTRECRRAAGLTPAAYRSHHRT